MFFTPFAFIQSAAAAVIPVLTLQGYYIGGSFTAYSALNSPYFRVLDNQGNISSSFNIGAGFSDVVVTVVTQSDGKIIAGGSFANYSGSNYTRIIRLNTNGTIDTTFKVGAGANQVVTSTAIQSDGKIVIGGSFTTYSGSAAVRIARINTDGTIDTGSSFNSGPGFNNTVNALGIQSNGKIVVGGGFTLYSGSGTARISRINTDGTIDTGSSWNPGTGPNGAVNSLVIQSDQKIVIGGNMPSYSGSSVGNITRINTDGTRDTTFNVGAGCNNNVNSIALQSDGKVVVGGPFTTYSGSTVNRIIRLNTSGTIDTTFNTGVGFDDYVQSLRIQNDGKILAQGNFTFYSGSKATGIVRINSDGTRDTTFNTDLSINTTFSAGIPILQLANGLVLLGGNYTGPKVGYITFLDTSGNRTARSIVDTYGFIAAVNTITPLTGSKILVGSTSTYYSGSVKNYITHLSEDGTVTTGSTWNQGTGFNSIVYSATTQSDGKILAGGSFTSYSGSSIARIARLNTDGTRDTTFNPGSTGANGNVNAIVAQADGKIILAGAFTTYSGSTKNYIARANADGTADTGSSWNQGIGLSTTANTLLLLPDQRIIVTGQFTGYSGSAASGLVCINTDGTRNTTFNIGTGFSTATVYASALQSDGKLIVGGNFTSYSGSSATRIARLNTDGTLDTTFKTGTGFNSQVASIALEQETGKVLAGGSFTTYSGSTANRIVRINTNGTIDNTFSATGSGFNSSVAVIVPYYT